jgi:hypothetical protein
MRAVTANRAMTTAPVTIVAIQIRRTRNRVAIINSSAVSAPLVYSVSR